MALCAACAAPPAAPPTAVIDAAPSSICEGDAFTTPIDISGVRSSARLSLVPSPPDPDAPPLSYAWLIEGADFTILSGALDQAELSVVTAGDRPLHVTLTVTNGDGGEATSLRTVGLVLPVPTPCDTGCDEGFECVEHQGERICAPACASDDECGCFVCDVALGRCVPPEAP
jgi:hypothetical protein